MYHNTHQLLLDTSWFCNKIKLRMDNCGIRLSLVLVARSAMINTSDCSLTTENNNLQWRGRYKVERAGLMEFEPWPMVSISDSVSTRQSRHFNNFVSTNIAICSFYLEHVNVHIISMCKYMYYVCEYYFLCIYRTVLKTLH